MKGPAGGGATDLKVIGAGAAAAAAGEGAGAGAEAAGAAAATFWPVHLGMAPVLDGKEIRLTWGLTSWRAFPAAAILQQFLDFFSSRVISQIVTSLKSFFFKALFFVFSPREYYVTRKLHQDSRKNLEKENTPEDVVESRPSGVHIWT